MLSHISKYDFDRGNLNMSRANREKALRRSVNARSKKTYQDNVAHQKKFQDCVQKVQRIKDITELKEQQNEARRTQALADQALLRDLIQSTRSVNNNTTLPLASGSITDNNGGDLSWLRSP